MTALVCVGFVLIALFIWADRALAQIDRALNEAFNGGRHDR
jgi:hypothetical protein